MTDTLIQALEAPTPHRFTVEEYQALADIGHFDHQRVELIDGEIIDMPAQRDVHAVGIMLVQVALQKAFPDRLVRCQLPLTLAPRSSPEPDFAVVGGEPRDYLGKPHPASAFLIVEISDTTLVYDRRYKGLIYSRANIPDYWILNLIDRQLEVHRNPSPDGYQSITILKPSDSISPLAVPTASIPIADMLP